MSSKNGLDASPSLAHHALLSPYPFILRISESIFIHIYNKDKWQKQRKLLFLMSFVFVIFYLFFLFSKKYIYIYIYITKTNDMRNSNFLSVPKSPAILYPTTSSHIYNYNLILTKTSMFYQFFAFLLDWKKKSLTTQAPYPLDQ